VNQVTELRVWAPNAHRVRVRADGDTTDLAAEQDGWWRGPELPVGTDYVFLLDDDDEPLTDPRSRRQPDGVHGPSQVYDPDAYRWQDASWAGRDLTAAVIYELHVGTFTPGATFDSAIERLDHLVSLGITHVELLPVNDFNGVWNWGYDGVLWYAVHETYGGPDGLKRFVDACHARGLAVALDVVYNHLGPSGNYLPKFGPYLKTGRNTWGDLVNLEEPAVRRYIIDNALMWLREFHVDALRLDAVHALVDQTPTHVLAELADEVMALEAEIGRPLSLIAESDMNDPTVITPRADGGWGMTAQWDDDVHHALHAMITGERQGYYCDFGSLPCLAKVFTSAFFHDGTYSTFRGRDHGRPVDRAHTPGTRFVICLQNHDQVGNRAVGDRITELAPIELVQVAVLLMFCSPFTPMLWMGEEWAASTRWPFFTSHSEPELAEATGKGRIEEFATHGWDVSQMIDPQDPQAYHEAVLRWDELAEPQHAAMLDFYRSVVALRAAELELRDPDLTAISVDVDEQANCVVVHRGTLRVVANLAAEEQAVSVDASDVVFATGAASLKDSAVTLAPRSAAVVRAR
jgi:maltooligosyltrehalose trehalohydrolase